MKKKILLILICLISLCSFSTVYAGDCAPAVLEQYKINKNSSITKKYDIYIAKDKQKNRIIKNGYIFKQKINGKFALCLDLGLPAKSEFIYKPTKLSTLVEKKVYTAFDNYTFKQAYGFLDDMTSITSSLSEEATNVVYLMAQLYIWISVEKRQANGTIAIVKPTELREAAASAYCVSFDGYGEIGCLPGQEGYIKTYKEHKNLFELYAGSDTDPGLMLQGKHYYSGDLAVYSAGSQTQPLLAPYKCSNPTTGEEVPAEEQPTDSCNYDYDMTNIPTNCSEGMNYGYISDIDNWGCIFNSTSQASPINSRYLEDNSNEYCNIYCREEIDVALPINGISVMQGKYMTVGTNLGTGASISPVSYRGKKTCRPTSVAKGTINVEKFLSDLQKIDKEIPNKWDEVQKKYAEWNAANESELIGTNNRYKCKGNVDYTETDKNRCRADVNNNKSTLLKQHRTNNNIPNSVSDEEIWPDLREAQYNNCLILKSKQCGSETDNDYKKQWTYRGIFENISYGRTDITFTVVEGENTWGSKISEYKGAYINAFSDYNNLVAARDGIISKINSCTLKASAINFNDFDPDLEINYDEPIYGNMGSQGYKLKNNLTENKNIVYYKGGDASSSSSTSNTTNVNDSILKEYINVWNCGENGKKCTPKQVGYYKTTWWELNYNKKYDYQLEDGIYRYIEKGSGQSVNKVASSSIQYIDVGFSNLPVHYSTNPGDYEYIITTNSLGNKNRFNNYISSYSVYQCAYNVSCQKVIQNTDIPSYNNSCPGSPNKPTGIGLNVVYRTISLNSKKEAFPGLSGTGRKPGENWNNDDTINKYIVNNRGVSNYEVYHLDPLYEIELTSPIIKKIREYNKTKNSQVIEIYSDTSARSKGIAGYSDFSNMDCDNGTHCKSSLIRGNVTGYNAIKVTGCAILNSGSYLNCGSNNQAW